MVHEQIKAELASQPASPDTNAVAEFANDPTPQTLAQFAGVKPDEALVAAVSILAVPPDYQEHPIRTGIKLRREPFDTVIDRFNQLTPPTVRPTETLARSQFSVVRSSLRVHDTEQEVAFRAVHTFEEGLQNTTEITAESATQQKVLETIVNHGVDIAQRPQLKYDQQRAMNVPQTVQLGSLLMRRLEMQENTPVQAHFSHELVVHGVALTVAQEAIMDIRDTIRGSQDISAFQEFVPSNENREAYKAFIKGVAQKIVEQAWLSQINPQSKTETEVPETAADNEVTEPMAKVISLPATASPSTDSTETATPGKVHIIYS